MGGAALVMGLWYAGVVKASATTCRRWLALLVAAAALRCGPTSTGPKLFQTSDRAPSFSASSIENLEHLGPTIVDHGVNFGVYSEHAERIEILLFDDPESDRPTRQFPLKRFGDVWNLYIEGVGVGQYYGYIAWGPNWRYDEAFTPGSVKGFVADVDALGNRFDPNKLLIDPYAKAIHRDHDWAKGSLATGPGRADSTWAAASKSIVVQSKYTWSANEDTYRANRQLGDTPGHRWNDVIMYELHPKGFTASPASGVTAPGTYRGLGEKAGYLKDLGITAVHLMPPFEKPADGGYWGYATINFFMAERTYSSKAKYEEVIDEFKAMVDVLHQNGIEVYLDVVYNHTGEGGFWRDKQIDVDVDPATTDQLKNLDAKETVGLYSFRGLDNSAYYALSADRQSYWNNTGVGNQTRPNHRPFRKLIVDSLRYWASEMHVDGFRFDLAPVLGERDDAYYVWENPKNTVLQDIADDPVLQQYNTRLIAEPWAAGGYDTNQSFNGPTIDGNSNPFNDYYGTRLGLFPSSLNKPGTGWAEWNGRFRDWWRAFWNKDEWKLNSTEVKDGGFFLTGSTDWFQWNGRKPYHSVNFLTVHDGFTMYDLVSYDVKQNKCGPLNPICCTNPTSSWCETDSGESNNRSRNWGQDAEPMKRQVMRNFFLAMMVSHGTPLLYMGDEWLRTQLGNNNAYGTLADNPYNWMDWGVYEQNDERHRMHDFVKQVIRFRKDHAYALAPADYGANAPFSWKNADNTEKRANDWGTKQLMLHYFDPSKGPELAILINGEANDVAFTLPSGRTWRRIIDTQQYWDLPDTLAKDQRPARASNNIWLDSGEVLTEASYGVKARTMVVLEARP